MALPISPWMHMTSYCKRLFTWCTNSTRMTSSPTRAEFCRLFFRRLIQFRLIQKLGGTNGWVPVLQLKTRVMWCGLAWTSNSSKNSLSRQNNLVRNA
jgi:hypothetical protein